MRTSTSSWALGLAAVLALTGCSVTATASQPPGPTEAVPSASDAVEAPETPPSVEPEPAPPAAPSPKASVEPSAVPSAEVSEEPVVVPSPEPEATPLSSSEPDTAPSADSEPGPAPADGPAIEPEPDSADDGLRQGDSGPEVLALQRRLSELGYWTGGADASFGALTTQAVLALQKAAGISRDGVVGPVTEAALESGTRPEARDGGDGIEIDLQRQLLLVVRDGHVVTALNTSTGVPGRHDTPRGQFHVERAIDGLRVAPLGELWRPRYFHRGYAVHGSPSIPAHPASHGCARLSDAAMNMIWAEDLMPIGSSVTVY